MTAWDTNPNLYASPYKAVVELARALLARQDAETEARQTAQQTAEPPAAAGCRC